MKGERERALLTLGTAGVKTGCQEEACALEEQKEGGYGWNAGVEEGTDRSGRIASSWTVEVGRVK